jgi:hypothetical protein
MIEQASLIIGDGNWAVKSDSLLGYALPQGKYVPREMSVVRATTGTRVNAAGLVEVVPYNLLSYSEQFENAYWQKDSGVTVNSNVVNAPNGSLTADRINFSTSGIALYRVIDFTTTAKLSIYLKGEGANIGKQIYLEVSGTGSLSVTLTAEWNRFVIDANNANAIAIKRLSSGQADSVLAWGAQLVEGTAALDYLPTTTRLNIPRIDYSTGSPALLLEPQRTNLVQYSQEFDNAYWSKGGGATITSNSTTAPDGTLTADTLNVATSTYSGLSRVISGVSSNYNISVYAKKNTKNWLYFVDIEGGNARAWFDLDNGVLGTVASGYTATITNVGNGWYRCTLANNNLQTLAYYQLGLADANNGVTPTSSGSAYLWGAQLEAGSYPTSYIPTTSASVTRNADSVSKTGISSLIGQTEGTIFLNMNNLAIDSDWLTLNPISGSPYTNSIGIGYYANAVRLQIYSPSGTAFGTLTSISGNNKIALAYKSGDIAMYINGVNVFSSSNAFSFNVLLDSITVASQSWLAGSIAANKIYSHSLYTTRLTNSELAQLTTP